MRKMRTFKISPIITDVSPQESATFTIGTNILISAGVTDDRDKAPKTQFIITDPNGKIIEQYPYSTKTQYVWKTAEENPLPTAGDYKMQVTSKDCAGNTAEQIVNFSLGEDKTSPTVTIWNPENESVWDLNATIWIRGKIMDNATIIKYEISVKDSSGKDARPPKQFTVDPPSVDAQFSYMWWTDKPDIYTITVKAWDRSNNEGKAEVKVYVLNLEIISVKFKNSAYGLDLDWKYNIIKNNEDINISLIAKGITTDKMPPTLKVRLYAKSPNLSAGGTNPITGKEIELSKVGPFNENTEYRNQPGITPSSLGVPSSGELIGEYAAVDGGEGGGSTDIDSNAFDSQMQTSFGSFQNRGIAKTQIYGGGNEENEIPFVTNDTTWDNHNDALNNAGLEVLVVKSVNNMDKYDKILTQNQADWFYYSGHGYHEDAILDMAGGMTPEEAINYWNKDMDDLILAGCSVLDIKDYRAKYFCLNENSENCQGWRNKGSAWSPGAKWEKLGEKGVDVLLGYNWSAPLDSQGADIIIAKWVQERAARGTNVDAAIEAWRIANNRGEGRNAAAIDLSKNPHVYWYWEQRERDSKNKNPCGDKPVPCWRSIQKTDTGWPEID